MKNTLLFLILSAGLCGCNSSHKATHAPLQESRSLPVVVSDGECDEDFVQPSLAEWANAPDTLLVGTVENVEPITDLVLKGVNGYPQLQSIDICNQDLVPGLEIYLKDVKTLRGKPADKRIKLTLGTNITSHWWPQPKLNRSNNSVITSIEPGDTIGALVTKDQRTGEVTPYHTPMFELDSEGTVFFQSEPDCNLVPVEDLDGIKITELQTRIAAAPSTTQGLRLSGDSSMRSIGDIGTVCMPTGDVVPAVPRPEPRLENL